MIALASLSHVLRANPWQLTLLHSAPDHRFFWITHGQGRVTLDAARRGLGVHTAVFVPAGQPIQLDPGAHLNGYMISLGVEEPHWPKRPILIRTRQAAQQAELTGLIETLARECGSDLPRTEDASHAICALVSVWLHRQMSDAPTQETGSAAQYLIAAFLDVLERKHTQSLGLAEYAAELDISSAHLTRTCTARLGQSATSLIASRTTYAARIALSQTDRSISVIASDLGFTSATYFSSFIKRTCGQSPRAVRQAAKRDV